MTGRERVGAALAHREPDRVPIDLGSFSSSTVSVIAYERLKRALGINTKTYVWRYWGMLPVIEPEVIDRLDIDLVNCTGETVPEHTEWAPRTLFNGMEVLFPTNARIEETPEGDWMVRGSDGTVILRMPKDGHYFDNVAPPREFVRPNDPKFKAEFEPTIPDEQLRILERRSIALYDTGKALVCSDGDTQLFVRRCCGFEDWMILCQTEPDLILDLCEREIDAAIERSKHVHQAVGDRVTVRFVGGDDMGTQKGPFIDPERMTRLFIRPYRRLNDWIHANTNWKTLLHSCGSVYTLMDAFIDAGFDCVNPAQVSAKDMEPSTLKEQFGDRITFWGGGCDTQHVLPYGSVNEIEEHVRENVKAFAPGGGYVFNQVHNIQADVPAENVLAMLEAAREAGTYPLCTAGC